MKSTKLRDVLVAVQKECKDDDVSLPVTQRDPATYSSDAPLHTPAQWTWGAPWVLPTSLPSSPRALFARPPPLVDEEMGRVAEDPEDAHEREDPLAQVCDAFK